MSVRARVHIKHQYSFRFVRSSIPFKRAAACFHSIIILCVFIVPVLDSKHPYSGVHILYVNKYPVNISRLFT